MERKTISCRHVADITPAFIFHTAIAVSVDLSWKSGMDGDFFLSLSRQSFFILFVFITLCPYLLYFNTTL